MIVLIGTGISYRINRTEDSVRCDPALVLSHIVFTQYGLFDYIKQENRLKVSMISACFLYGNISGGFCKCQGTGFIKSAAGIFMEWLLRLVVTPLQLKAPTCIGVSPI
jgi:hypothetical protein